MDYNAWHARWEALKAHRQQPSPEAVLEHWAERVPALGIRTTALGVTGYRKANAGSPVGEGRIEAAILGHEIVVRNAIRGEPKLHALYHSPPLARTAAGQVYPDALGVLDFNGNRHPIAIEVKVTANDCWSAVVQCLRQVKMLRRKDRWLQTSLPPEFQRAKGVWGMVLAPSNYYERAGARLPPTLALLKLLHTRKTDARIMLAEWDDPTGTVRLRAGYLAAVSE